MMHAIVRCLFRKYNQTICNKQSITVRYCSYRANLQQYTGGSVYCEKDTQSGIAVITLDHIERKNALSGSMMVQLCDVVSDLEAWTSGKGVILRGVGGTFCSGGDLKFMKAIMDPEQGIKMSEFMQTTLQRLFHLPLLSLALIEGQVLGGGAELALACDLRLATANTNIGFVQSRMGVSPGWGGGHRLVQLVGRSKALQLLCSGCVLSGEQAKILGLVDEVWHTKTDFLTEAQHWLSKQVPASAAVTRVAKQVVLAAVNNAQLQEERRLFGTVWGGEAHHAALSRNIKHQ